MKFIPAQKFSSTSLQGKISISYAELVKVFGPEHCDGDGYKVQAEWMFDFEDGTVATIYDYKMGKNYNGPGGIAKEMLRIWHIGGKSDTAVQRVIEAIEAFRKSITQ